MTKLELTKAAKAYMDKLADGYDPVADMPLDSSSIGSDPAVREAAVMASRQIGGILSKHAPAGNRQPGAVDRIYDSLHVLESLGAGRDPFDGEPVPKGDPMASARMRRCFSFAAEQVDSVYDKVRGRGKASFRLPFDVRDQIAVEDGPVIVTALARNVNAANPDPERVNGVQAQLINDYLEEQGMLAPRTAPGALRLPTDEGKALGLYVEPRQNKDGNVYDAVLFPPEAQRYVIGNIDGIEALARAQREARDAARLEAEREAKAAKAAAKPKPSRGKAAEAALDPPAEAQAAGADAPDFDD